jgi:hypothetical protein
VNSLLKTVLHITSRHEPRRNTPFPTACLFLRAHSFPRERVYRAVAQKRVSYEYSRSSRSHCLATTVQLKCLIIASLVEGSYAGLYRYLLMYSIGPCIQVTQFWCNQLQNDIKSCACDSRWGNMNCVRKSSRKRPGGSPRRKWRKTMLQ